MKDFIINVTFRTRTHQYRIVPQVVNKDEELFSLVGNRRTVLIRSTLNSVMCNGSKIDQRNYSYNTEDVTNACLMKKVIDAIDNHLLSNIAEFKLQNAIAV
ncbi:MAG: hypothetical protein ACM3VS_17495 [Candidatus Dadabacteria bacterium]